MRTVGTRLLGLDRFWKLWFSDVGDVYVWSFFWLECDVG